MDKILVPTDGSPYSLEAAEYAAELAKRFGSEVLILNVIPPYVFKASRDWSEAYSIEALEKSKRVFKGVGVESVFERAVQGNPAEIICKIAEEEDFDLIVLGSHGTSGIEAFFLGGVSEHVSHHAGCSLLIVR